MKIFFIFKEYFLAAHNIIEALLLFILRVVNSLVKKLLPYLALNKNEKKINFYIPYVTQRVTLRSFSSLSSHCKMLTTNLSGAGKIFQPRVKN